MRRFNACLVPDRRGNVPINSAGAFCVLGIALVRFTPSQPDWLAHGDLPCVLRAARAPVPPCGA